MKGSEIMPRGTHPNSRKNLKPRFNTEIARKAQRSSVKSRKANAERAATIREALELLLDREIVDENGDTIQSRVAIAKALCDKALKGDVKAFIAVRDSVGEKPVERIQTDEFDPAVVEEVRRLIEEAEREV